MIVNCNTLTSHYFVCETKKNEREMKKLKKLKKHTRQTITKKRSEKNARENGKKVRDIRHFKKRDDQNTPFPK